MTYVILGTGAVASLIAAYMVHAQQDVILTDTPNPRLAQVQAEGIVLTGFRGDLHTSVETHEIDQTAAHQPLKWVLVCVHPDELEAKLAAILPYCDDETTFVSLLSGLTPLRLPSIVGAERCLYSVANFECRLTEAGIVETNFHNFIWTGEASGQHSERLATLQLALSWVAPSFMTQVIQGMIWSKAIYSLETALAALVDAPPHKVYAQATHRRLAAAIVRENLALTDALGVTPIAFDFFDPNLYRATTPGEGEVSDVWIKNAWIRHEQYRVGLTFPAQVGLTWQLSPVNPQQEATALFGALLATAQDNQQDLPLTRRLAELHAEIVAGQRTLGWDNLAAMQTAYDVSNVVIPYPEV